MFLCISINHDHSEKFVETLQSFWNQDIVTLKSKKQESSLIQMDITKCKDEELVFAQAEVLMECDDWSVF